MPMSDFVVGDQVAFTVRTKTGTRELTGDIVAFNESHTVAVVRHESSSARSTVDVTKLRKLEPGQ